MTTTKQFQKSWAKLTKRRSRLEDDTAVGGIKMETVRSQVSISNLSLLVRVYQLGHFHEFEMPL